jgi:RNA polymerase sigma-70 factor, ECF subfamily
MTDGDAIQRVVEGDLDAFSFLLERHHASCLRYARRLLGNAETAEEVVQDSFLRAFRGLARYDHRDRFRAWLFRILVNRCRTRAAQERHRDAAIAWNIPVESLKRDAPFPERQRCIDRALQELPSEYREAFLLKYVEELSYEEMAAATGDSIPALKMRVLRARTRLKQLLDDGDVHGNGF